MKIDVPKHLYDDWARDWPGTTITKLFLKDQREKLLLLTISGKPEAFITHKDLVEPLQYARSASQGAAKAYGRDVATWQRAGLFHAELQCSPRIRPAMWKRLWDETLGKIEPPPVSRTRQPVDPFFQDEPRDYGAARPWDSWFG